MPQKKTHEEYLEELKRKNIPYLPISSYINGRTYLEHTCPNGHTWHGMPARILAGHKCNKCAKNKLKTDIEYNNELFQKEIDAIPLEGYKGALIPILHECIEGHQWKIAPANLLNKGRGCPSCTNWGFDLEKPAILYFVSLIHEEIVYYKVGITNRTAKKRLSRDWNNFQFNLEWAISFTKGKYAKDAEKIILDTYSTFKAPNAVPLLGGGSTEVLTVDITSEEAFILVGHLLDPEKLSIYVASPIKA